MLKHLLSICLLLSCSLMAWGDDTQTVAINGENAGKTVKHITFNGDKIILHYTDNTTYEGDDLSLVVITFSAATGISKPSQVLDEHAVWYDLSGRRLPGVPTQSGTYIKKSASKTIKVKK